MLREIIDAKTTVMTCAGYVKIHYTYQQPEPCPTLNSLSNFYRHNHFHNATKWFFERLIEDGPLPEPGDIFEFDDGGQHLVLTVTDLNTNYVPSEFEIDLMRLGEELGNRLKKARALKKRTLNARPPYD